MNSLYHEIIFSPLDEFRTVIIRKCDYPPRKQAMMGILPSLSLFKNQVAHEISFFYTRIGR